MRLAGSSGLVGAAAADAVAGFFLVKRVGGFGVTMELWRSRGLPMPRAPAEVPGHRTTTGNSAAVTKGALAPARAAQH
jgi:hypothetical protein